MAAAAPTRQAGAIAYFDRIADNHNADLRQFVPWAIGARVGGFVHAAHVARLLELAPEFAADDGALRLDDAGFSAATAILARVAAGLAAAGQIRPLTGERYPVITRFGDEPLAAVERAAVPWLGVRPFGVHLNGFVRRPDGPWMWIGERARDKPTFPGRLDNLVAGGQPFGLGVRDNLVKECAEEAGIDAALAHRAVAVSTITYVTQDDRRLKPDTLFCFDLELPATFVPRPVDGEMTGFFLLPIGEVAAIVRDTRRFKPNCSLVVIDFLLRHDLLAAELSAADRTRLRAQLRAPLP